MPGGITPASTGLTIAQLINSLTPILLGAPKQTTTQTGTGTTAGTSTSAGTQSQTTTPLVSPDLLQNLLDQYNTANANATNPANTAAIVNNIIKTNTEAFTPTIGAQNSAGLYNSSTLELLSAEAQARSTAQASQAVLNYTTSQQQLAQSAASALISDTRGTTTSGSNSTATTNNSTTTNNESNVKVTAPLVSGSSLLQGAAGIGASLVGKSILSSDLVTNNITNPIKNAISSILPGGNSPVSLSANAPTASSLSPSGGALGDIPGTGTGSLSPDAQGIIPSINEAASTPGVIGSDQAVSEVPGLFPGLNAAPTDFTAFSSTGAATDVAGGAGTATIDAGAPVIDAAANIPLTSAATAGTDITAGIAAPSIAAPAVDAGTGIATSAATGVATDAAGSAAGADFGVIDAIGGVGPPVLLSDATTTALATGPEIAGNIIGVGAGAVDAGLSGAAGDALATGAEIGGGIIGTGAAVGAGVDAAAVLGAGDLAGGIIGAGAADAGIAAAGGAAAGGLGIGDILGGIASVIAWIICTELNRQGRMKTSFYRYGYKKFASYSVFGRRGYYLWAIPTVKHLRKHPNSWYSKFICWSMNHRIEWIAASMGCKFARKTVAGFLCDKVSYGLSWILAYTYCWLVDYDPFNEIREHKMSGLEEFNNG